MPLIILSLIFQVALVIHIIKTGRDNSWIWVVAMLPLAGGIAYIVIELLPSFFRSKPAGKAKKKVDDVVSPNKALADAAKNFRISDTVENTLALAEELTNKNLHKEAANLYRDCLKGQFEHDPAIMTKLAFSLFSAGEYAGARRCLDDLIEFNPDYKNADAHLLYARCLDELNETEAAIHEYEALSQYYPGPESNFRFALMLINLNRADEARVYLEEILERAEHSASHYSVMHKEWLSKTKNLLKTC